MNYRILLIVLFFFAAVIRVGAIGCVSDPVKVLVGGVDRMQSISAGSQNDPPAIGMTVGTACEQTSTSFGAEQITGEPVLQWSWNFGDGSSASGAQVFHQFDAPGNYQVTLTAFCSDDCMVTIEQMVTVHPKPVVLFETSLLCSNIPVLFTDNSTTPEGVITGSSWLIGGSFYSGLSVEVLFQQGGIGSVIHTVMNSNGCYSELSTSVDVNTPPEVIWTSDPVCVGSLASFEPVIANSGFPVAQYVWNLGDGTTSQLREPNHYYTTAGSFNVSLMTTDSFGCTGTYASDLIIRDRPDPDFLIVNACSGQTFDLIDQSVSRTGDPIITWTWTLPGNLILHEQNPVVVFDSLGLTPVQLSVVTQNGCSNTIMQQIPVWPVPKADFIYSPMIGEAPVDFQFTDQSTGATSWKWFFGDTFSSEQKDPLHTFTLNGTFYTRLIASNQYGCSDTLGRIIRITAPILDIRVSGLTFEKMTGGTTITCEIRNTGSVEVKEMQLSWQLGSATPVSESLAQILYPDSVLMYTFQSLLSQAEAGEQYVCVSAHPVNIQYAENNFTDNSICRPLQNGMLEIFPPYPNPGDDRMFIRFVTPRPGDLTLRVCDAAGRLVMEMTDVDVPEGFHQYFMDISSLENGHYLLLLQLGNQERSVAFMKMKSR